MRGYSYHFSALYRRRPKLNFRVGSVPSTSSRGAGVWNRFERALIAFRNSRSGYGVAIAQNGQPGGSDVSRAIWTEPSPPRSCPVCPTNQP
jgi:hypothetical protein